MDKKLVVITGANSGVGLSCSKQFSKAGYPTLLLDLNVDVVSALELESSLCMSVDVLDAEGFREAVTVAQSKFGPVDCLVNNAGIMFLGSIADQPANHWKKMLGVNVDGVLNGIQACIDTMKGQKHGTIINMGSLGAIKPLENHGIYNASKAAIHSLSEMLRQEVASDNVRVSVLAPGAIDTNLINNTINPEMVAGHKNYVSSIGGALSPDDIAKTIISTYQLPQHVCLREAVLGATRQVV